MKKPAIIEDAILHVRDRLKGDSSGHDWRHVERVYRMALRINEVERGDELVVALAALLHDVSDYKLNGGDVEAGPREARAWLESQRLDAPRIAHIERIIATMSFKGAGVASKMDTLEGKIVQDADRLDAIGAIGIARAFAYGGKMGRDIYDPDIAPTMHRSFDSYRANQSSSINHFHEKLLLLKGLMNTATAKKLAEHRHCVMLEFLNEFDAEWKGNA